MSDIVPFNKNSYVAFDGLSIRDIIINRLNQSKIFTDQNYQGSNMSGLIDIVSYTFNTLLYYLNKTSSESMFSESQIYENMNRIVKLIDYKPIGRLGQNVPFGLIGTDQLAIGNYFIPRYSYVNVGGTRFSLSKDIGFSKLGSAQSTISDINNNYLLYQGGFQEYPLYVAAGIDNEVIYIALDDTIKIDHFNIFVYVKPKNATKWQEWQNVHDTFSYKSSDTVYTTRFNENLRYEIQFGDNINGKKVEEGDQVAIYYLQINSDAAGLAPNSLNGLKFVSYNTNRFNQILQDTVFNIDEKLSINQLSNILLYNDYPSNSYSDYENVDSIRQNAPKLFKSQNRLITISDYESFIESNFYNIISDANVVSNEDYMSGHIKYLLEIGLNNPQIQNQILFNQIKFANSCNFNNIYVYSVPKNELQDFLSPPQKELIRNGLEPLKTITSNIVISDPVYMYLDFYVKDVNTPISVNDISNCKLRLTKSKNSRRASSSIISDVKSILLNNFNHKTNKLGQIIDLYKITSDILNIDGIESIQTYRTDTKNSVNGLSLLIWNELYPENDASVYTQNVQLKFFQYPVFNQIENIISRIEVVDNINSTKSIDI